MGPTEDKTMSSEQRALESIKTLAENIQAANAEGVQVRFYGDDDETTLEQAILSCAGIAATEKPVDVKVLLGNLVDWLTDNRLRREPYGIFSIGQKMAKINCGGSVHCFVAMEDNITRTLGKVKRGQIFKPASWKAPAKHARGDLYNQDTWAKCFGDFSVRYMN